MRLIATAAVVAASAAVPVTGAGALGAHRAAQANVTIEGSGGDFSGKVKSSKSACVGDRKVIVYKLKGNGYDPHHDTRVGSDVSEIHRDHGVWSVGNSGFKHGAFYAYAPRVPGCKPGFSLPLQR
jgi:hypothetical protein